MALPSDPEYIPACEDERIRALPVYQDMLASNTDPYAAYSRNEDIIRYIEEFIND